jgi:hypothetical protein
VISISATHSIECRAPIISERRHLSSYIGRDCTRLTGTLLISSFEHVSEDELRQAFELVQSIDGNVIIRGSAGIKTLYFLSSLKEVGNVTIVGNRTLWMHACQHSRRWER